MASIFSALHLSDLHFGPYNHWCFKAGSKPPTDARKQGIELAREIHRTLKRHEPGALEKHESGESDFYTGAVVITGDFIWGGKLPLGYEQAGWDRCQAYESALAFVDELESLGIVDTARANLLVVPGNHDIVWATRDTLPAVSRDQAEKDYRSFLDALFRGDQTRVRPHLGSCVVLPTRENPPRPVVLFGLNSCRIETRYTPSLGWIGYDQIADLIASDLEPRVKEWKEIHKCELTRPICLAALHHHLHLADPRALIEVADPHKVASHLTDAPKMIDFLMDLGFQAVMHGHAHSARSYGFGQHLRGEREFSTLMVGGAGSVGLCLESGNIRKSHQFEVIDFDLDGIHLRSYEARLTPAALERPWQPVECDFPLDFRTDGTFCEAMRAIIRGGESQGARYELQRFESLIDFEALVRGEKRITSRLFDDLWRLHSAVMGSSDAAPPPAARDRYRKRVGELRRAPDWVRTSLQGKLREDPADRLDRFLYQDCTWKQIFP